MKINETALVRKLKDNKEDYLTSDALTLLVYTWEEREKMFREKMRNFYERNWNPQDFIDNERGFITRLRKLFLMSYINYLAENNYSPPSDNTFYRYILNYIDNRDDLIEREYKYTISAQLTDLELERMKKGNCDAF